VNFYKLEIVRDVLRVEHRARLVFTGPRVEVWLRTLAGHRYTTFLTRQHDGDLVTEHEVPFAAEALAIPRRPSSRPSRLAAASGSDRVHPARERLRLSETPRRPPLQRTDPPAAESARPPAGTESRAVSEADADGVCRARSAS
jgi:hypothetical protein